MKRLFQKTVATTLLASHFLGYAALADVSRIDNYQRLSEQPLPLQLTEAKIQPWLNWRKVVVEELENSIESGTLITDGSAGRHFTFSLGALSFFSLGIFAVDTAVRSKQSSFNESAITEKYAKQLQELETQIGEFGKKRTQLESTRDAAEKNVAELEAEKKSLLEFKGAVEQLLVKNPDVDQVRYLFQIEKNLDQEIAQLRSQLGQEEITQIGKKILDLEVAKEELLVRQTIAHDQYTEAVVQHGGNSAQAKAVLRILAEMNGEIERNESKIVEERTRHQDAKLEFEMLKAQIERVLKPIIEKRNGIVVERLAMQNAVLEKQSGPHADLLKKLLLTVMNKNDLHSVTAQNEVYEALRDDPVMKNAFGKNSYLVFSREPKKGFFIQQVLDFTDESIRQRDRTIRAQQDVVAAGSTHGVESDIKKAEERRLEIEKARNAEKSEGLALFESGRMRAKRWGGVAVAAFAAFGLTVPKAVDRGAIEVDMTQADMVRVKGLVVALRKQINEVERLLSAGHFESEAVAKRAAEIQSKSSRLSQEIFSRNLKFMDSATKKSSLAELRRGLLHLKQKLSQSGEIEVSGIAVAEALGGSAALGTGGYLLLHSRFKNSRNSREALVVGLISTAYLALTVTAIHAGTIKPYTAEEALELNQAVDETLARINEIERDLETNPN